VGGRYMHHNTKDTRHGPQYARNVVIFTIMFSKNKTYGLRAQANAVWSTS
jgi:hypothetical protein